MLYKMTLDTSFGDFVIETLVIDAESFNEVETKLEDENVIGILKIGDNKFLAFIQE
jgi:hypothetical protein|tara:strand:+ start:2943 stop:3110 length:168 start_codon:yes stop_codon:yes gene_type:complete